MISKREMTSIFLLPNKVLKKIYICNKNKKIISHTFLVKLFKSQIGYPKNFTKLNLALSTIMKWYSDKGYQWALAQIIHTKDPSSIVINIDEGLIKKITIEYYNSSVEKFSSNWYTHSIEQYLGIRTGSPININRLQKKINYLKDNKLVANIMYSVERSKDDLTSVEIIFQIQELKDKELLVITKYFSQTYSIINFATQLLAKYLNLFNVLTVSTIKNQIPGARLALHYFQSEFDSKYNNDQDLVNLLFYRLSNLTIQPNSHRQLKSCINVSKEATIGFKLYLRNLNKASSYFVLSIKSIKDIFNFKFLYLNPSLQICKKFNLQIIIEIWKKNNIFKDYSVSAIFEKHDIFNKKIINQCIFEGIITYNFTSYFSISEKILLSENIQSHSFFVNSEILSSNQNTKTHVKNNYDALKQSKTLFNQRFFALLLSLYYQDFDSLDWPTKGSLFEIKSLYFTPFQRSDFFSYNFVHNYEKSFSHKISIRQISHWSLPFYVANKMNHTLVNTTKIQSAFSKNTLASVFRNCYLKNIKHAQLLDFCLKLKMEYYIPLSKSSKIFFFCNYFKPFFTTPLQTTCSLNLKTNIEKSTSFLDSNLFYGLGMQMKLPINQIPPVSIEYTVNSDQQFCIYLHIPNQH